MPERPHLHGDLQALLRRLAQPVQRLDVVPAHIARTVGWNTGFSGPAQVISGSWYKIQSYNANQSLVLVRNPSYWGTPGKLDKIVFQFFSDDSQLVPALQNKEINIFNPATVSLSITQTANQVPNTTKATLPGLEFEHFDFNQADPYLAKLQVREAIAHGTDRQTIITSTVGEIEKGITPLGSRMLVSTQKGYRAPATPSTTRSRHNLMKEAGFKKASDGYFQPDYGPQKGKDLTFTIQSTSGNSIRSQSGGAVPGPDEGDRDQNQYPELRRQHVLRDQPPQRHVPDRRVRLGHHTIRFGEPAHLLLYTNTTNCGETWNHAANSDVDKD